MLREARPDEAAKVQAIIASEIAAYEVEFKIDSGFKAPGEGAIELSILDGDAVWIDDDDPRRVAWAHPNDPHTPTSIFIMHVWGESEKHDDLLEEVCDVGAAKWPGVPVHFPNVDTPLLKKVKDNFIRDDQKTPAKIWVTTFAEAKEQRQKTKKVK